jgi:hypothetical protein
MSLAAHSAPTRLDEGMFDVVDLGIIKGIVIQQNFYAVATELDNALDAPL